MKSPTARVIVLFLAAVALAYVAKVTQIDNRDSLDDQVLFHGKRI